RPFHQVGLAIEFARLFALGYNRPDACRREECWNARTAGAYALRKSTLWNKFQVKFPTQYQLFEQSVLTYIRADVLSYLSVSKQNAQAEAADHDGCAILDISNRLVCIRYDLVHLNSFMTFLGSTRLRA